MAQLPLHMDVNETGPIVSQVQTTTSTASAICPDLLSIRDLGTADGWRGHAVRGFFRVLKIVTGV